MTPSSAFSKRRQLLRRPKICFPPPPPPIPPPADCECYAVDGDFTIGPGESESIYLWACCDHLPHHEIVGRHVDITGGEWIPNGSQKNCEESTEQLWNSPEEEGVYYIVITFTFADDTKCETTITATVEEEEEEEDPEE